MEFIDIYTVQWAPAPALAWIVFGVITVISYVFLYIAISSDDRAKKIFWACLTAILFILFAYSSFILFSSIKTRYVARINDAVSLQEVAKDWDIIEQKDDNIWILERKDNND